MAWVVSYGIERGTHPLYVSEPIDDQHQSLTVVAHASEEEDHFWHEITVFADSVCLLEIVRVAGAQEGKELGGVIGGREGDLRVRLERSRAHHLVAIRKA